MTQRERRFWNGAGMVTGQMIGTLAAFTGIVTGLVMLVRPKLRKHKKTDLKIFELIKPHTTPSNTRVMSAVTVLGKHKFLVPANLTLIFYFLFIRKHTWFSIRIASIALSSLGLMFALKYLFKRKRPDEPVIKKVRQFSFPSGHAIYSVTFYGLLVYIVTQSEMTKPVKGSLVFSLMILIQMIGLSRVYLRVHYPSDVAAGYIIGFGWLLTAQGVLKRIEDHNKQLTLLGKQ